jgi:CysZ protein
VRRRLPPPASLAVPGRPGFFGGARAFLEGIAFVVSQPSVWAYAAVPVATAIVLTTALGILGVYGARAAALAIGGALGTFVEIVLVLVAVVLAVALGLALAQPLSGWALDRIVDRQTRQLGARAPRGKVSVVHSILVNLLPIALSLPVFAALALLDVLAPPAAVVAVPLKFVLGSLLVAWDLFDYPLSHRGIGLRARLSFLAKNFGAFLGFGLAASVILLVPGVGLLVLPFGVAGSSRLVARLEPSASRPTSRS